MGYRPMVAQALFEMRSASNFVARATFSNCVKHFTDATNCSTDYLLGTAQVVGGTRLISWRPPDLLPSLPSFIRRVCSGYAPDRGVLRTQLV
jgi:hypothetical protein